MNTNNETTVEKKATSAPIDHMAVTKAGVFVGRRGSSVIESIDRSIKLSDHTDTISALAPLGQLLVSGSWDKTVRIWNPKKSCCIRTVCGLPDVPDFIVTNQTTVVLIGFGYALWEYDIKEAKLLKQYKMQSMVAAAMSRTGKLIVTATDDQTIRFWSGGKNAGSKRVEHFVERLSVTPNGQSVFCALGDRRLVKFDLQTGSVARETSLLGHPTALTSTDSLIAIGTESGHISLFSVKSGEVMWERQFPHKPIHLSIIDQNLVIATKAEVFRKHIGEMQCS